MEPISPSPAQHSYNHRIDQVRLLYTHIYIYTNLIMRIRIIFLSDHTSNQDRLEGSSQRTLSDWAIHFRHLCLIKFPNAPIRVQKNTYIKYALILGRIYWCIYSHLNGSRSLFKVIQNFQWSHPTLMALILYRSEEITDKSFICRERPNIEGFGQASLMLNTGHGKQHSKLGNICSGRKLLR